MLSREPPEAASLKQPRHCPEIYANNWPLETRSGLVHRANMLKIPANRTIRSTQTRYKEEYDKKVRFERKFAASYYVFADLPH